jgi:NAD+ diphosphatase
MHFTYCPHCGNKLIDREIGDEGIIPYCEACQVPLWDMFSTSVICAVINEFNEIALLRQEYVSAANYVCVAGIIQLGENAEETAIREIQEEIGLEVETIQYIRSYFYDKKSMLMLGYKASVRKGELTISKEVNSAEWIPMSEALKRLREGSIAWQLVKEINSTFISK